MRNWSTDLKKLSKHTEEYPLWKMEQMINYGLEGEKLVESDLKKNWDKIKRSLDPYKRRVLEYLLWEKQYSLPTNLLFWK